MQHELLPKDLILYRRIKAGLRLVLVFQVEGFYPVVELVLLFLELLEPLNYDLASSIGLNVESIEVEYYVLYIDLQIHSHLFLNCKFEPVLVNLLDQLLLFLAGQVVNVALDLLDSPRNLYLKVPVLALEIDNSRFKLGYFVPVIYLLVVEPFDRSHLVERFLKTLQLLLKMLVIGIRQQ